MASSKDVLKPDGDGLWLVQQLVELAKLDSVYRDVYLDRAAGLLAPILSREQYDALKGKHESRARLLDENRRAVAERDWARVKELSRRAEFLNAELAEHAKEFALAEKIYGGTVTSLDPFSPGYEILIEEQGQSLVELRREVVARLDELEEHDPHRAAFYAARRRHFEQLAVADIHDKAPRTEVGTAELEREAARAAAQGQFERAARLAEEIVQRQSSGENEHESESTGAHEFRADECPVALAAPFPDAAVHRAAALGFVVGDLPLRPPEIGILVDFMYRNAWHPSLRESVVERDGAVRLTQAIEERHLSPTVSTIAREFIDLFMRHLYVNGGGARYLPPLCAETLLVEGFPEDADPPDKSPLLEALGLPRRRALSRVQIEHAIAAHGASILRGQLGLDLDEYCLLCVPYDVYVRLGLQRGWGKHQYWTHFDGYQVMSDLRLRALVGGSSRYGGVADLVSISREDERAGVFARFAVVRRARLVARWR